MTTAHNIDLPTVLAERLTTAHPDVLRELLATFIHTLMGAEADALCGAGYGERVNSTPVQGLWILRSRSCGKDPTSRTGCWSAVNAPSGP